jgi:hypothetical protein
MEFSVLRVILNPLIATFLMGAVVYFLSPIIVKNLLTLILLIGLGAILYFVTMFALAKNEILSDIAMVRENLKK